VKNAEVFIIEDVGQTYTRKAFPLNITDVLFEKIQYYFQNKGVSDGENEIDVQKNLHELLFLLYIFQPILITVYLEM